MPTFGPRFSDPFFSEFLAGIGNEATRNGYDLLVSTNPPGDSEIESYERMAEGGRVDGFIIVRSRCEDSRIEYLLKHRIPFAAFGSTDTGEVFPHVDEDGELGMRLLAEHLISLGFVHIAYISPDPALAFTKVRLRGLQAGLAAHGYTLDESYVRSGDLTQQGGYENAQELLKLHPRPNAIVTGNDLMAFGAMSAVQEQGLTVGEDIAIAGFDDIPMAEFSHPPLTTVHQPVFRIGTMVCEMLIQTILGEPPESLSIILEPTLVPRRSCGERQREKSF